MKKERLIFIAICRGEVVVTWVRACDAVDARQGRPLVSDQVASLDNFICNHLHVPNNAERGKSSEAEVHPI
jgi:hypothetical protein